MDQTWKDLMDAFVKVAPIIGKICEAVGEMPNVQARVLDWGIFWDTLAERGGWKLQKNKLTNHFRIIDPEKIRRAWGSADKMKALLATALD